MKKILKVICVISACLMIAGCKQTIDSNKKIDYSEIELSNVEADSQLMKKADDIFSKNYKKTTNNTEKQVVVVKYLDDIYQIASNRVSLDLDILSAFSKDYENYIATLQAYSEVYLEERDELVSDSKLTSKNSIQSTNSGKMLDIVIETTDSFLE